MRAPYVCIEIIRVFCIVSKRELKFISVIGVSGSLDYKSVNFFSNYISLGILEEDNRVF